MMDRHVPSLIIRELSRYPDCEEGGKYIGFMEQNVLPSRVVITDFLPGGPNAKRSRVEFLPDGEYQERLFRLAEKVNQAVEHLGSWHSHHCNSLQTLSDCDIAGYFKTVNKPHYRPDFFLASLVTRIPREAEDADWLQHFLFVRGDADYYDVGGEVTLVDAPTVFGHITGHSKVVSPLQESRGHRTKFDVDVSAKREATFSSGTVQGPYDPWFESEIGKQTLAEDRKFFLDTFGERFKATRVKGQIRLTGVCSNGIRISIVYPAAAGDDGIQLEIASGQRSLISISCGLSVRTVALAGAVRMQEML